MSTVNACKPTSNRRTRTPADLKYLLNERAAAAGALSVARKRAASLRAELALLEAELHRVRCDLELLLQAEASELANLDALDTVIRHLHPGLDPSHVKEVRAQSGRYGRHGALTNFLKSALLNASSGGLTTTGMCELAAVHFGLTFKAAQDRVKFRDVVKSQLQAWRDNGLIRAYPTVGSRVIQWRLVGHTGVDLLAAAAANHEQEPDTLRGEVGG